MKKYIVELTREERWCLSSLVNGGKSAGFRIIARDTMGELLCAVLASPADKKINPMAMPMP